MKLAPARKECCYCGEPMDNKGLPPGVHSHGVCKPCGKELDEVTRLGENAIKVCPKCPRNIGAWLKTCKPCEESK